jgi:choline dehydrogenase-like flavoprotein
MLPRWENRMTLHATKKDRWGMPLVHLDVNQSDNERRMSDQAKQDIQEMLAAAGCRAINVDASAWAPGAALFEAGTAVMGQDPKSSVLNSWNQIHDAPNVFVTDSACMASNGDPTCPSLTLMALTARAASHATDLLRDGKL